MRQSKRLLHSARIGLLVGGMLGMAGVANADSLTLKMNLADFDGTTLTNVLDIRQAIFTGDTQTATARLLGTVTSSADLTAASLPDQYYQNIYSVTGTFNSTQGGPAGDLGAGTSGWRIGVGNFMGSGTQTGYKETVGGNVISLGNGTSYPAGLLSGESGYASVRLSGAKSTGASQPPSGDPIGSLWPTASNKYPGHSTNTSTQFELAQVKFTGKTLAAGTTPISFTPQTGDYGALWQGGTAVSKGGATYTDANVGLFSNTLFSIALTQNAVVKGGSVPTISIAAGKTLYALSATSTSFGTIDTSSAAGTLDVAGKIGGSSATFAGNIGDTVVNLGSANPVSATFSGLATSSGVAAVTVNPGSSISSTGDAVQFGPITMGSSSSVNTAVTVDDGAATFGAINTGHSVGAAQNFISVNSGTGTFSGTVTVGDNSYFQVAGGTAHINGNLNLGTNSTGLGNLYVTSGTMNIGTVGSTPTITVADANSFVEVVGGTANVNVPLNSSMGIKVGNGTDAANASIKATQQLSSFEIKNGASASLDSAGIVLKANTFTMGSSGSLDVKTRAVVAGGTTLSAVRALVTSGWNSGSWDGAGIKSTSIPSGSTTYGVGYALGSNANLGGSIGGVPYADTDVLVRYTYLGDANLDGLVDANDLGLWAVNYHPVGAIPDTYNWSVGDWNYDGLVDANDLGLWSVNYKPVGPLVVNAMGASPQAIAMLTALGATVVPEPSSFLLLALGAAMLVRRRGR